MWNKIYNGIKTIEVFDFMMGLIRITFGIWAAMVMLEFLIKQFYSFIKVFGL